MSSSRLDSHLLLTTVLAGDGRLVERLRSEELLPLGSRMRVRLSFERTTPDEMLETLRHVLVKAGNAKLMTAELMTMLVEHSTGNYRTLMTMAQTGPQATRWAPRSSVVRAASSFRSAMTRVESGFMSPGFYVIRGVRSRNVRARRRRRHRWCPRRSPQRRSDCTDNRGIRHHRWGST
jgi:hypothetical protein